MRKHTRRRIWPTGHMLLPKQVDDIVIPVHASLAAIEYGAGKIENRHTLAAFLNIANVCAGSKVGTAAETIEAINHGLLCVVEMDKRFKARGVFALTGPEMRTMRHAITLSDALMRRVNSAILMGAVEYVSQQNAMTPEVLGSKQNPISLPERLAA